MENYKVVIITKNLDNYPQYSSNTKLYPELLKYVSDEIETFVINVDTNCFYIASEFFYEKNITNFSTN